jgi:hypothetical protein
VFRDRRNREWVVVAATGELFGWKIGAEGAFVLDAGLRRWWSATAVSARARYARWLPDAVLALIPPS